MGVTRRVCGRRLPLTVAAVLVRFKYFVAFDELTRRGCGRRVALKVAGCFRFYYFFAFDGLTRRDCGRRVTLKAAGFLFRFKFLSVLMGRLTEIAAEESL